MAEIQELRREIDRIDRKIIELLDERIESAGEIGKLKAEEGRSVDDPEREKEVLERAGRYRPIFRNIIDKTKEEEGKMVEEIDRPSGRIGIVGYGKMGRFFAEELSEKIDVGVYYKGREIEGFESYDTLEDLYKESDYVLISTPMEVISDIVDELSSVPGEGKTVFDISTFKKGIVDEYKRFSTDVSVASVHPMFGTGVDGLVGEKVIVIEVEGREEDTEEVEDFFSDLGCETFVTDADTHDEMMKRVIGIPYFLGISYLKMVSDVDDIERFGGTSFDYLTTYSKAVLHDDSGFIEELLERSEDRIREFTDEMEKMSLDISELKDEFSKEIKESYRIFNRCIR